MATIKAISSRENPLLVRLRKVAGDPGAYRKHGEFCLEGDHLCSAWLQRGGVVPQAVITEAAWEQPSLRRLAEAAQAVSVVPTALMAGLSSLESPPPLMYALPWQGVQVIDAQRSSVVLDRLQDAGNVGAILRSAAAFGFTQVIAIKGTAALWSPKVLRAGMGAHFGLHLVEQVEETDLGTLAIPLLATSSHTQSSIHQVRLPWPCAWVMGHEGQGIAQSLQDRCSQALRIPQPGGEESLNVAAAAAVCLYESARQRAA
jgi:TrmH family RNA methyltransferase